VGGFEEYTKSLTSIENYQYYGHGMSLHYSLAFGLECQEI